MSIDKGYYENTRSELAFILPNQYSKVLEIGCGSGKFRQNLHQEHEYWGVEPVAKIAALAQVNLGNVLIGSYQDVENLIPDDYFDLVICNDVIEHMPDHDWFLESIKSKLSADGYLVASIPNVRYVHNMYELIIKRDWEYREAGILDRTHLRFFTMKSLLRTLNQHAFSVKKIAGINPYRPRSIKQRIFFYFATIIFGGDIRYLQYAIRIKLDQTLPRIRH